MLYLCIPAWSACAALDWIRSVYTTPKLPENILTLNSRTVTHWRNTKLLSVCLYKPFVIIHDDIWSSEEVLTAFLLKFPSPYRDRQLTSPATKMCKPREHWGPVGEHNSAHRSAVSYVFYPRSSIFL